MGALMSQSVITMHQGLALGHVADRYPTLEECVLEAIQNGIDAKASHIEVKIDLMRMNIHVTDNGQGVSRRKFDEALSSVCKSVKERGSLGQFGIGLIAFLGKCESFRFVSCPKQSPKGYLQWTFNTKEILVQEGAPSIPCEELSSYFFAKVPSQKRQGTRREVNWRTGIFVHKFDRKKIVRKVSLEGLAFDITTRYGIPMRELGTTVGIKLVQESGEIEERSVRAMEWSGIPLDEEIITDQDAGEVTFRMFLTQRRKRALNPGAVSLGESNNPFRLPFTQFARHAGEWLEAETVTGLKSGVFEGEILCSGVQLNANRRQFNQDQALVGLCATIDAWWKRVGRNYFEVAMDEAKNERYETLAKRSLAVVEELLKDKELGAMLRQVIKSFKIGTVGLNHAKVPRKDVLGEDEPGTAIHGSKRPRSTEGEASGGERGEKPAEHPEQIPLIVTGPSGRPRKAVASNSLGIRIAHDEIPGVDKLWIFDAEKGCLIFNIIHPIYAAVEKNDTAQMRLMEQVLFQVLVIQSFPDADWHPVMELFLERFHPFLPFLLLDADRVAGRGPGRPRKS